MKKRFLALLVVSALLLCSCDYHDRYDEGYDAGYDAAESDAQSAIEEAFEDGYLCAKEDMYDYFADNLYWIKDAAECYAADEGGWHPEEAWMIIDAYRNNEPSSPGEPLPTWQEYQEAIDSMISFYEYFLTRMYESRISNWDIS